MAANIKDRMMQYLDSKNLSPTRAEQLLQWGKGSLIKANSISANKTGEFLLLFKDLSAEWLLRGEGEMIKGETPKSSTPTEESAPITNERLFSVIESQQRTIENLSKK